MRLSPVLRDLPPYPFARLRVTVDALRARGVEILDFGMGEPREETPRFIRDAVPGAIEPIAPYPATAGLPELRAAITRWLKRRFDADVDAVIPTLGTKEVIFSLAGVIEGAVAVPSPAYPVYERGALFAGKEVVELPLRAEHGFLPDLDADPVGPHRAAVAELPEQPDGGGGAAVAVRAGRRPRPRARLPDLLRRGLQGDLLRRRAPRLDPAGRRPHQRARAQHAVQALGDAGLPLRLRGGRSAAIAALARYRPNTGTVPQDFVQRVSVAAWDDEDHVEAMREIYRAKRDVLLPACEAAGLEHVGGDATMFLWLRDPGGVAERLLERGVDPGAGRLLRRGRPRLRPARARPAARRLRASSGCHC